MPCLSDSWFNTGQRNAKASELLRQNPSLANHTNLEDIMQHVNTQINMAVEDETQEK